MTQPSTLRFFAAVLRPTAVVTMSCALVAAAGWYLAIVNPAGFDQAASFALFVQMFAAASGYRERLVRGHFDPILAGRLARLPIPAAHWILSIAPVSILWILLGLTDAALVQRGWPTTLTVSGIVALAYVSSAAWAISVWLGRYSAGALWTLALFGLAAAGHIHRLRDMFMNSDASWAAALSQAGAAMACPLFLIADPSAAATPALLFLLAGSAAIWSLAATFIVRFDAILMDPV